MKKAKKSFIFVLFFGFCLACHLIFSNRNQSEDSPTSVNLKKCKELENEMLVCISFVEDFKSEPYFCGARWTIGYGSTVLDNGERVTKKTPEISKEKGRELCLSHLRKHVYPFLSYVKRELSTEELLGTIMFIYNIGGEAFSGYDENQNKVGKASSFLTAINNGQKGEDCAQKMTGFCASNGKRANGLLKRHWVQGAVFCGILTPQMLLELEPAKFYQTKNMGNYYRLDSNRNIIRSNGFYCLNFDQNIQNVFFKMNKGKKKTSDILDDKTLRHFL